MASFSAGAGASVIIANKCGLCGTTTRQRNYQNPPTEAVLSFFKQFTPDATWQHYFCSKCTMRAQRRLERDQSSLLQGDVQRSVTSAAPHRTNSITLDSQPLAFSSQGPEQPEAPVVVLAGGAAKRPADVALTTEDSSLSSDHGSVQTVAARDNVTKRRRISHLSSTESSADAPRFPTQPEGAAVADAQLLSLRISPVHVAASPTARPQRVTFDEPEVSSIDPDDMVPLHLLAKPSKKPRQRKHKAPTSAAAVPRSPGGRMISINDYVRSGAG